MARATLIAGLLTAAFATSASAQLPSASTRALGMGDNFTAVARGYAAVSWNPAMLGLPGNPGVSLALLPVRGIAGLGPVTLKDFKDYGGQFVPTDVREQWLQHIETKGKEQGTGGADATLLALQIGRFAVQVSSLFRGVADLAPGAAELLFFGNAGRTGEPRAFTLTNSSVRAHAESTVAASYAIPLGKGTATSHTSIGITGKYTIGHFLMMGMDQGSTTTTEPSLDVNFPVVGTSTKNFDANAGNGFGLDVGFAMRRGTLTLGAVVQNVVNTFKWDQTKLVFRQGTATFDANTKVSNFDEMPFAQAPANLQALVSDSAKFKPTIGAGAAVEVSRKLTVSADFRARVGETSIEQEPKVHAGLGAEFRFIPILPIRVGVAGVTGGFQVGGGLGLNLGPLNLAASIASRSTELGTNVVSMFTLISTIGR